MKKIILFFCVIFESFAQEKTAEAFKKGNYERLIVDGKLDEQLWKRAKTISGFIQHFPEDKVSANQHTMVWMVYDDKNLYFAAKCYDTKDGEFITSSLRRDFKGKSDKFEVYIDPYGEGNNGYFFGVTPLGVEREGLITEGSEVDSRWDCVWESATKRQKGYWTVEMKIPFHTLNYRNYNDAWKVNFVRYDYKNSEISSSVGIPRNYDIHNLANTQPLKFKGKLSTSNTHFNVSPYISGGLEKIENSDTKLLSRIGIDSKIRIGSALNLDLTINPDFSQVEVDRQITNLSRFEIQFEERRQFFIENNDLFGNFGFNDVNPFFSRRVGVGRDPFTQQFKQQPILFGARLSGKIDDDTRIGVMTLQTAELPDEKIASQNYSVFTIQRKVQERSNVSFMFANRNRFESDLTTIADRQEAEYNRVIGVDYNLITDKDKWRGKAFVHHLFRPDREGGGWSQGGQVGFNSKYFEGDWKHEIVGKNYRPDFGFVRLTDYYQYTPQLKGNYYFGKKFPINKISYGIGIRLLNNLTTNKLYEKELEHKVYLKLQNTANLSVYYIQNYVYLFEAFDPTNTKSTKLPIGDYYFNYFRIKYESDKRKEINGSAYVKFGDYFSGKITSFNGHLVKRFQPNGELGLEINVNHIKMPEPYASRTLWLIGPNLDWAFNKNMFLKTVIQYNSQIENINTNIRFQWRYKPMSDFYLVFTNNYSDDLRFRNVGLIFKVNYWIG
ncbi:DUF5916 domain-containing protein [Arcicella sp. LKC2W]|uniref:carbohydrate binding family 9 domain-containing protein n=1 Tax=Arcicella sp. LKC2W TaxID=2984198 RepID=UPI002B1E961E|nr:DUF5916 domain-containing protein [Arcicella sp. LKC2W]MEA5461694.1 DUF5916 domain-containing protein [Arcicella sp. LKC2W]